MGSGVSKKSVQIAVALVIALAVIGAYRGFRSSTSEADVAASSDSGLPTANAVAARQASALQEAAPSMLSEAQIRTIARQEAQAALAARNAPASSSSSSQSDSASTASTPRPAPADRPAPAPTPQPPPPPAPAAEGNQPPLF